MLQLIPAPLHRMALRLVHNLRHRWRKWRGVTLIGCSIVVTDHSGAILLVRHHYGPASWSLPGGGLKRGENPEDGAMRELAEEVGIASNRLEFVCLIEEELSRSPHACHLFALTCDEHPTPDNREIAEARFFPAHSLPEPMGNFARRRISAWQDWRRRNS